MSRSVYVTAHGSRVVPRAPFVISFRPPRFLVEHEGRAVAFGPVEGRLGFNPLGGASVEDVTSDVAEYPPVPIVALHTEHFAFPVGERVKVFSTPEEVAWPFELQLESASDADEMLHIRGPLPAAVDPHQQANGLTLLREGRIDTATGRAAWTEWQYDHRGRPWRQRFYAVALLSTRHLGVEHPFAVTAQAALERSGELFSFTEKVVEGLASQR